MCESSSIYCRILIWVHITPPHPANNTTELTPLPPPHFARSLSLCVFARFLLSQNHASHTISTTLIAPNVYAYKNTAYSAYMERMFTCARARALSFGIIAARWRHSLPLSLPSQYFQRALSRPRERRAWGTIIHNELWLFSKDTINLCGGASDGVGQLCEKFCACVCVFKADKCSEPSPYHPLPPAKTMI